jgi:Tfp pilus assembly ATPase PilU
LFLKGDIMGKLIKKGSQDFASMLKKTGAIFINTDYRRFIQIDLDYTDTSLFNKKISSLIPSVMDAIVHVKIRVNQEDCYRIDLDKIYKLLEDAYYVRNIVPIIVKKKSKRIKKLKVETTLFDAIELFVKYHKPKNAEIILEESKKIIQELGIDALLRMRYML